MSEQVFYENNENNENLQSETEKDFQSYKKLRSWEIWVLLLSFCLIAFVAIPNFYNSLEDFRGKFCSKRLTLVANCLKYLAKTNKTKPGEKICELFDLNQVMAKAQGVNYVDKNINTWFFLKVGAKPDCASDGSHTVNLNLGADGEIIAPTCTYAFGPKGEHFRKKGLHTCNLSKVTGELSTDTDKTGK